MQVKEAMLVIRGSQSIMDWSINLEDEMCDYVYTHIIDIASGVDSANSHSGATTATTTTVQGVIHKGLYTACIGLLEGYNLRPTLLALIDKGYSVKVVGHSLGAGIATLIAAELRVTLIARQLGLYKNYTSNKMNVAEPSTPTTFTTTNTSTDPNNSTSVPMSLNNTHAIPRPTHPTMLPIGLTTTTTAISAINFSCPAFLSPNLAEAFMTDRLLINVVYDKDVIPRFSFKTIQVCTGRLFLLCFYYV